jgi:hypothetical protein
MHLICYFHDWSKTEEWNDDINKHDALVVTDCHVLVRLYPVFQFSIGCTLIMESTMSGSTSVIVCVAACDSTRTLEQVSCNRMLELPPLLQNAGIFNFLSTIYKIIANALWLNVEPECLELQCLKYHGYVCMS